MIYFLLALILFKCFIGSIQHYTGWEWDHDSDNEVLEPQHIILCHGWHTFCWLHLTSLWDSNGTAFLTINEAGSNVWCITGHLPQFREDLKLQNCDFSQFFLCLFRSLVCCLGANELSPRYVISNRHRNNAEIVNNGPRECGKPTKVGIITK